jgi:putative membrane protein
MSLNSRFSTDDLARIKKAVFNAESKISGEIVPVFVESSGNYMIANYRGALVASISTFLTIIFLDRYAPAFAIYDPLIILIVFLLAGIVGAFASNYFLPIKRLLLNQEHLDQATRNRAERAFLEQEVFFTKDRTGILIFVSFFEREVIIMADKGISKVVDQREWDALVRMIIEGIQHRNLIGGMEAAIKRSGEILLEKGFTRAEDDINELGDDLRIE